MFEHCLYFNTTALARLLDRAWATAFAPFELTPSQGFMLRAVLAQPGLLQRELATILVIARATATRSLDGLSSKDLIERRTSPADARESMIFPTRQAQSIRQDLDDASADVTARLKKQLGADQFAQAVGHLGAIRRGLG